jgi:scyllo-inositol 2-dehydrogenase (NADP+)
VVLLRKVNVGLVGFGFSGATFHAPIFKDLEEFNVKKVMSTKPDKVREVFSEVEVVKELENITEDPEIDVVVITTPNDLHYEMAVQAIQGRKHTIVEKPFVVSREQARHLIELSEEYSVLLSVYQNRRWDNDFLTVQSLLNEHKLGEVYFYEATMNRFSPYVEQEWRNNSRHGGGVLYDLGSHLIDQALILFGMPKFVYGDVLHQRKKAQVDDYFHLILGYKKLRVILHAGSIVKKSGPTFEIHGDKGSFTKYGRDNQWEFLQSLTNINDPSYGEDDIEQYGKLTLTEENQDVTHIIPTKKGSYVSYYKKIYDAIVHNEEVPVPASEALRTIEIIEAAQRSAREKKAIYL